MINFKITGQTDGNLTVESSPGKTVLLSPGETVRAEVIGVLPSGSVSLKIKGEVITAKTAVPLQQGETAFFRVADSPASPNELRLRFLGYEEASEQNAVPLKDFMSSPEGQTLAGLIQELSDSLPDNSRTPLPKNQSTVPSPDTESESAAQSDAGAASSPADLVGNLLKQLLPSTAGTRSNASYAIGADSGQGSAGDVREMPGQPIKDQNNAAYVAKDNAASADNDQAGVFPLNKVESLLKALPADINALPKEIKTQLQDLLGASLRTSGQSIQSRLITVSAQISDVLKNTPAAENFRSDMMLNMEGLISAPLKSALLNTGVVFEAKLKSAAVQQQLDALSPDAQGTEETVGPADSPVMPSQGAVGPSGMQNLVPREADTLAGIPDSPEKTVRVDVSESAGSKPQDESKDDGTTTAAHSRVQVSDTQSGTHDALPAIRNDLKAVLLELKQLLPDLSESRAAVQDTKAPAALTGAAHSASLKDLQGKVEGLLKDIETFQALSKTTDSFYTFLPVDWKALRDGEVSFKRGQTGAGGGASASCRINLDLDKFGTLSILVLMHNKDFFVSFKAARPDTSSLINSNLDDLKSSFREKGLSLKAAHMLEKSDTSMEQIQGLGASERAISIKA